jgi:hypothetical protein
MHGIRELCATQKTSLVNVLSVELRNSRLSLSSSHIGIRDDSGFAKISVAVRRLLSSVTLPVNQHSLPPQVARLAARRRRLGCASIETSPESSRSFFVAVVIHVGRGCDHLTSSELLLLFSGFQDLERTQQALVNAHHGTSIVEFTAIVGRTE